MLKRSGNFYYSWILSRINREELCSILSIKSWKKVRLKKKSSTVSVKRIIMNTIRKYEGSNGISLQQLKKILRETKKLDIALHDSEIKLALKNAMDRGILSREGGSYKVVKAKARAKSSCKDDKTTRRTKKEAIKAPKRNSSAKKPEKRDGKKG